MLLRRGRLLFQASELSLWDLAELIQLTEGRQRIRERLVSRLAVVSFSTVSQHHRHRCFYTLAALLAAPHQLPSARRFGPNCVCLSAPANGVCACACVCVRWLCVCERVQQRRAATAKAVRPTDAIQAGRCVWPASWLPAWRTDCCCIARP